MAGPALMSISSVPSLITLTNKCYFLSKKKNKPLPPWKKNYDEPRQKQRLYIVKAMVFPSSHVWMWELNHKEGSAPKNWSFQNVLLEKTLESPLDSKEIKPVNPEGNQAQIFIGRTDAEAEVPVLWPLDVKSLLIEKDPDAGKDWGQEEKGVTEDELVGWHHQLNGHEFEETPGDGEGQGSLCAAVHGITKSRTRLSNWTTILEMELACREFRPLYGDGSRTQLVRAMPQRPPLSYVEQVLYLCLIFKRNKWIRYERRDSLKLSEIFGGL